jgi:hypothetical protein
VTSAAHIEGWENRVNADIRNMKVQNLILNKYLNKLPTIIGASVSL